LRLSPHHSLGPSGLHLDIEPRQITSRGSIMYCCLAGVGLSAAPYLIIGIEPNTPHMPTDTKMNDIEPQATHSLEMSALPRIPLDPRKHKRSIIIHFSVLVFFSSILPVVLYFGLRYGASVSTHTIFEVIFPIIGAPALVGYLVRSYRLLRY
jgi:hypothetical protein